MRRLSSTIVLILWAGILLAQEESPHGADGPPDCASCHAEADWWTLAEPLLFDHDTTDFALDGAHDAVDCKSCHTSLVFSEASEDCASCHQDIHSGSVGRDCVRCHNTDSWLVDEIPELHEQNGFPLVGPHSFLNCIDCHDSEVNLRFDRLGNDCVNCHMEDFVAAEDPNHVESGFSTDCIDCHDVFAHDWDADLINHDFFPLEGGHDIRDCAQCHFNDSFTEASPECVSCHQEDYDLATNPNHIELGFGTDCMECHNIQAWDPAEYDHSQFPLLGAHEAVSCNECHEGVYENTPSDCFACHEDVYNASRNPDHITAGFGTDCTECHDETAWVPSTLDHDGMYFPIYSGNHRRGTWNQCTECHIEPANYAVFSCIDCHEHSNRADVDGEHRGISDYRYESNACLRCHPNGDE